MVQRVINCTGPDSDFRNLKDSFLKSCIEKGIVVQDELRLGVEADKLNYQTINKNGECNTRLLVIGSLLRGNLWESTAVNEIRKTSC
jgi:uncharacterized NAD(P)/FAD-binding protein YdhS